MMVGTMLFTIVAHAVDLSNSSGMPLNPDKGGKLEGVLKKKYCTAYS